MFRNDYYPRIAVTVDMIATGTDVRPLKCLLFMHDVRSRNYFEQMKGIGTRTLEHDDLKRSSPWHEMPSRRPPLVKRLRNSWSVMLASVFNGELIELSRAPRGPEESDSIFQGRIHSRTSWCQSSPGSNRTLSNNADLYR